MLNKRGHRAHLVRLNARFLLFRLKESYYSSPLHARQREYQEICQCPPVIGREFVCRSRIGGLGKPPMGWRRGSTVL
jgi:hypothetical protein